MSEVVGRPAAAEARVGLIGVYAPPDPVFVSGSGSWLTDEDGRRYLDFTSGLAVTALGHGAPAVREAIESALADGIVHTSNLFRTAPAEALARELAEVAWGGRVFFCNSGAESVEAALKFARKWARSKHGEGKTGFVAFHGSFHGRLFGSLAVTDRPSYRAPFEPLMPGAAFHRVGDAGAVEAALRTGEVAAVIIEPVQGEGGVRVVPADFLRELRVLCDEHGALLIFDEVQCGLGRTGLLFAGEHADVRPDLMTLAKPLAGGLPIGAVVASERVAELLVPGDHATTFGGGPVVSAAARAVLSVVSAPSFLATVRERARQVEDGLRSIASRRECVREIRGLGLIWGIDIDGPAGDVVARAREGGLLVCTAGPSTVRLLPPLNVSADEVDQALAGLEEALP